MNLWPLVHLPEAVLERIAPGLRPINKPVEGVCWIWLGWKKNGYGRYDTTGYKGRITYYVHRMVWQTVYGIVLSPEQELDHLCRNRACVRPTHLEIVDRTENNRRRYHYNKDQARKRGKFA